jgi:hypothetical protein
MFNNVIGVTVRSPSAFIYVKVGSATCGLYLNIRHSESFKMEFTANILTPVSAFFSLINGALAHSCCQVGRSSVMTDVH